MNVSISLFSVAIVSWRGISSQNRVVSSDSGSRQRNLETTQWEGDTPYVLRLSPYSFGCWSREYPQQNASFLRILFQYCWFFSHQFYFQLSWLFSLWSLGDKLVIIKNQFKKSCFLEHRSRGLCYREKGTLQMGFSLILNVLLWLWNHKCLWACPHGKHNWILYTKIYIRN